MRTPTFYKLIVAGSRNFSDSIMLEHYVLKVVDILSEIGLDLAIVSGTANGADRLGEMVADKHQLHCIKVPALWDSLGKKAGYRRNELMAETADGLMCFRVNYSPGSSHMIKMAQECELDTELNGLNMIVDTKYTRRCFVFGSNLEGIHGAGAALYAVKHWGAQHGMGVGPQGQAYAIPTKITLKEICTLAQIKQYVNDFIAYAKTSKNTQFLLTKIGCGYAGYSQKEIAPLFKNAPDNVVLVDDNGDTVCKASDWLQIA